MILKLSANQHYSEMVFLHLLALYLMCPPSPVGSNGVPEIKGIWEFQNLAGKCEWTVSLVSLHAFFMGRSLSCTLSRFCEGWKEPQTHTGKTCGDFALLRSCCLLSAAGDVWFDGLALEMSCGLGAATLWGERRVWLFGRALLCFCSQLSPGRCPWTLFCASAEELMKSCKGRSQRC